MILSDGVVTLKPFRGKEEIGYLVALIKKYDRLVPSKFAEKPDEHGKHFWTGWTASGERGGVIYLSYYTELDWWVIHAQRDERHLAKLKDREDWSARAARLVIDYFFKTNKHDRLYSFIPAWRRKTDLVLRRLGFSNAGIFSNRLGDFKLLVKARLR